MFACLYHGLCDIARGKGYALAIHGTLVNDMDLIAVPWIYDASSPEDLLSALKKHIHALSYREMLVYSLPEATPSNIDDLCRQQNECPSGTDKPHGRRAWNLYLDHGTKIDLSVMPLVPAACAAPHECSRTYHRSTGPRTHVYRCRVCGDEIEEGP